MKSKIKTKDYKNKIGSNIHLLFPLFGGNLKESLKFGSLFSYPIEELNLPVRCNGIIHCLKIQSIGELLSYSEEQLLCIKNCGKKSISDFRESCKSFFKTIKEDLTPTPKLEIKEEPLSDKITKPVTIENIKSCPIFTNRIEDITVDSFHKSYKTNYDLHTLPFSVRTQNVFHKLKLNTIGELLIFPIDSTLIVKGAGVKTKSDIQDVLIEFYDASINGTMRQFKNLQARIEHLLSKKKKYKTLFVERYDHPKRQTLQDLGKELGLTRERVRQIIVGLETLIKQEPNQHLLKELSEGVSIVLDEYVGAIDFQTAAEDVQYLFDWNQKIHTPLLQELINMQDFNQFSVEDEFIYKLNSNCKKCDIRTDIYRTHFLEGNEFTLDEMEDILLEQCSKKCNTSPDKQICKPFIDLLLNIEDKENEIVYDSETNKYLSYSSWKNTHRTKTDDIKVFFKSILKPIHKKEIATELLKKTGKKYRESNFTSFLTHHEDIAILWDRGTYFPVQKMIDNCVLI